jgi:hypothetical protein
VREIAARREKTREKNTKRREKRGILLKKKVAIRLLIRRIIMEKVGKRKREVVEANCSSPQGRE